MANLFNMVGGGQFIIIDAIGWGKWKVFQLMDLLPSNQFVSKGKDFMELNGRSHIIKLFFVELVHFPCFL